MSKYLAFVIVLLVFGCQEPAAEWVVTDVSGEWEGTGSGDTTYPDIGLLDMATGSGTLVFGESPWVKCEEGFGPLTVRVQPSPYHSYETVDFECGRVVPDVEVGGDE